MLALLNAIFWSLFTRSLRPSRSSECPTKATEFGVKTTYCVNDGDNHSPETHVRVRNVSRARVVYYRVQTRHRASLRWRVASATQERRQDDMNQAVQPQMFVDGNNVMRSRPDGWWRDRAGAARRIVAEIALLARNRKGVWTIVFDGPGPRGTEPSLEHLAVIHAGHGGRDSADDRIVELVGALPDRAMALVYTSDAALRTRLHAMGAQALLKDIAAVPTTTTASPTSTSASTTPSSREGERSRTDHPKTPLGPSRASRFTSFGIRF